MFGENTLIIPDRVLKSDLPFIIHFFEDYNIATLQDAEYYDHVKDEYDNDNNTVFGYVIVKVKSWHDNNGAVSFYESLLNNKAKLVYNDPVYWDVKLYNNNENSNIVIESSEGSHETMNSVSLNTLSSPNLRDNDSNVNSNSEYDDEQEWYYEEFDKYSESCEEEVEEYDEDNVEKDPDYEFSETDTEQDNYYEYTNNRMRKLSNRLHVNKNQKHNDDNLDNNKTLVNLLLQKNKNYMKNDKRKSFKNEWSRRLRVKTA